MGAGKQNETFRLATDVKVALQQSGIRILKYFSSGSGCSVQAVSCWGFGIGSSELVYLCFTPATRKYSLANDW
jgi:hypothetical protein